MAMEGPRSKIWGVDLSVLMLGLLVMAQHTMQLSLKNPYVERSNCNDFSYLGLVLTSDTDEQALQDSDLFVPDKVRPYVDIAGRRFHIGTINNHGVVYVKSGYYSVNAAMAVQILVQRFRIYGIVHFGSAGSLNNDLLPLGYVSAPQYVSFTGAWEWKRFQSNGGQLVFGNFNYPENGESLLASVDFEIVPRYSENSVQKDFYLPITSNWHSAAIRSLKDLELAQCAKGVCLGYKPGVVFKSRGSTSDIYLKNKAYGEFLYKAFNVSSADQESAAVALVSLSNDLPFIVFRGISNSIYGDADERISYLASRNAVLAAARFIDRIPSPRLACAE